MVDATIGEVCKFFGMKLTQFKNEWTQLSDEAKAQLKAGIGDGSLTY